MPRARHPALVLVASSAASAQRSQPPVPDRIAGGAPDDKHDWNLGPTGARGWIWGWRLETTEARPILITRVEPGTPAEGVRKPDDEILGVAGESFTDDAHKSLGRAIGAAEPPDGRGRLRLQR